MFGSIVTQPHDVISVEMVQIVCKKKPVPS